MSKKSKKVEHYFMTWLKRELLKCHSKDKGYRYYLRIIQEYPDGRRRMVRRKMVLHKDRKGYLFSVDKVAWITVAKIQRIKSYEHYTKAKARIKIIPIK